jgi:hypothetical protein
MNANTQIEFLDAWLMLLKLNKQLKGITRPSEQVREISFQLSKFINGYQNAAIERAKEFGEAEQHQLRR